MLGFLLMGNSIICSDCERIQPWFDEKEDSDLLRFPAYTAFPRRFEEKNGSLCVMRDDFLARSNATRAGEAMPVAEGAYEPVPDVDRVAHGQLLASPHS